jgi:hypothetical protein
VWMSIVGAALQFGAGHLPSGAALTPLTPIVAARTVMLNGLRGVLYGWFYWRLALARAMVVHGGTDWFCTCWLRSSWDAPSPGAELSHAAAARGRSRACAEMTSNLCLDVSESALWRVAVRHLACHRNRVAGAACTRVASGH